jgi:hypothetical protein
MAKKAGDLASGLHRCYRRWSLLPPGLALAERLRVLSLPVEAVALLRVASLRSQLGL